ncbi:MaoC/PaaZ C-terminal domain-containing protein [Microbacterium sp. NPDC058062]|uniref:MaoC/PaaZ C-terminal domain-containing protein n=1 Tax=Microbacterium sp. NPDC058062 TaxID=3346320 RepID=UPI0036DBA770
MDDLVGVEIANDPVRWGTADAALYALAVGAGRDDPASELAFTTDNTHVPQRTLPTFAATLAGRSGVPAMLHAVGEHFDLSTMLHGDQTHEQFEELPPAGSAEARTVITGIWDKGRAAVVQFETTMLDVPTGRRLSRSTSSMFFRGAGGWGGPRGPQTQPFVPDEEPAAVLTATTSASQPLLYRLTGDANPLHTDPEVARASGFERPIMHGMSVFGVVGRTLLNEVAAGDPARFDSLSCRFAAPVMPGDTLAIDLWMDKPGSARFTVASESGHTVLSDGAFEFSPEDAAAQ